MDAKTRLFRSTLLKMLSIVAFASVFSLLSIPERAVSQTCESYDPDHILVKMNDRASAGAIETMKSLNGGGEEHESRGLENLWVVTLPAGLTVPETVDLYEASPGSSMPSRTTTMSPNTLVCTVSTPGSPTAPIPFGSTGSLF